MTEPLILIPARYDSQRFPGKPLARIRGARGDSKSLVERTYLAAKEADGAGAVYVATDDARIADAASGFGADVVMTSSACRNGTERCAEAVRALGLTEGTAINVQGDAPLTPSWYIEALIDHMGSHPDAVVATPVLRTDEDDLSKLIADRQAGRVGGTTAVFDRTGRALYFSKEILPFSPAISGRAGTHPVFLHVGVYAYRIPALMDYPAFGESPCEAAEGLEQLRFIENGIPISCVEVEARGRAFWELNNPSDVAIIEDILQSEDRA